MTVLTFRFTFDLVGCFGFGRFRIFGKMALLRWLLASGRLAAARTIARIPAWSSARIGLKP
jgi:hypothetical protein